MELKLKLVFDKDGNLDVDATIHNKEVSKIEMDLLSTIKHIYPAMKTANAELIGADVSNPIERLCIISASIAATLRISTDAEDKHQTATALIMILQTFQDCMLQEINTILGGPNDSKEQS